ncbi:MAG TPA: AAA family ATPase [Burkholderiales bacterium]|nr:AAA family ATPase [Burkholderiales bacterium]
MYLKHFGFAEPPFSIAPDPRYLYLSDRHREALAHLLYGVRSEGGFVLLSGEVGAGKTTLCRALLERMPSDCDLAFIFNPKLTALELLSTICDELHIDSPIESPTVKLLVDLINHRLLKANAAGRRTVLIIDEAQNLSDDVLEQVRLLTNLETNQRKLLQVVLLAQPELRDRLRKPALRQLAQRIVARYHLQHLSRADVAAYVNHRLAVAGVQRPLFPARVLGRLYRLSRGVPRLINVICDRALLGAYVQGRNDVNLATLNKAAQEVFGAGPGTGFAGAGLRWALAGLALVAVGVGIAAAYYAAAPRAPAVQATAPAPVAPAAPQAAAPERREGTAALPWHAALEPAVSEATALATLFRLWGTTATSGGLSEACAAVAAEGLRCLESTGGLDELAQMNLPAVLRLSRNGSSEFFAALAAIDGEKALIVVEGAAHLVPLSVLKAHWDGSYAILWRGPPGAARELKRGTRGAEVTWLLRRLDQIEGRDGRVADEALFDLALQRRVMMFQSAHGLEPDGVAGSRTLARLSALTDGEAPRLASIP